MIGSTVERELQLCREAIATHYKKHGLQPSDLTYQNGDRIAFWQLHRGHQFNGLTWPIEKHISYILEEETQDDAATRLRNLRPISLEAAAIISSAQAEYEKTLDTAKVEYQKVMLPAWEDYQKVVLPAHSADVQNSTDLRGKEQ